jgi:hypothetical protein
MGFNYENTEVKTQMGGKIVRKVSIKNGKGYKSVTKYRKGKKISSIKKHIHNDHINLIKSRKFIPGLFSDCKSCKKNKTLKKNNKIAGGIINNNTPPPIRPPSPDPQVHIDQLRQQVQNINQIILTLLQNQRELLIQLRDTTLSLEETQREIDELTPIFDEAESQNLSHDEIGDLYDELVAFHEQALHYQETQRNTLGEVRDIRVDMDNFEKQLGELNELLQQAIREHPLETV